MRCEHGGVCECILCTDAQVCQPCGHKGKIIGFDSKRAARAYGNIVCDMMRMTSMVRYKRTCAGPNPDVSFKTLILVTFAEKLWFDEPESEKTSDGVEAIERLLSAQFGMRASNTKGLMVTDQVTHQSWNAML